jgi:hypothetical protein
MCGQVVRRISVGAQKLKSVSLFCHRELDALIDKPVPLIVGDIIGVIERGVYESTPDCSARRCGVNLVGIVFRWTIAVFTVDVAGVDDNLTRQLSPVPENPLPHITLMTMRIKGLT